MIRCLLDNNDTVVDKFLSESVLEMEYLEQKVATLIVTCDYNQMQWPRCCPTPTPSWSPPSSWS